MNINPVFKNFVDDISKIATSVTKLGIFIGAACILAYCISIGFFPQDLTLGDGLLFLMAACCFGAFYALLIFTLICLGICIVFILSKPIRFIGRKFNIQITSKEPVHEFAKFNFACILPAIFGVILIFGLGKQNRMPYVEYGILLLQALLLYVMYSLFQSCGKKLKKISEIRNSLLDSPHKEKIADLGDPSQLRAVRLLAAGMIVFSPLLLGQIGAPVLAGAMRFAKIRIEQPAVYLKPPYSLMLPNELRDKAEPTLGEYARFDGIKVLFSGFGKTTVIAFPDHSIERSLKIPNDQIIVE